MKNKKKLTRILIIAGIILLLLVVIGKKQGWIGQDDTLKVSTEQAAARSIIETVSANGKIQPEVEVKISPYISGEVVELLVIEGDQVEQGDLLAKIDPEIYISTFEQMEASLNTQRANEANSEARLAQSEARMVNAQQNFKRQQSLWKQEVISPADFDAAKSSFEVAQAEVTAARQSLKASKFTVSSAEARLKEARENLNRTSIYAPTSGTVSKLNVEKGERVMGASQFSSGTEVMRVANLSEMEVRVEVNENDIVRVNLNDTALIEVDAYLNRKFRGLVSEIATSASVSGALSTDQVTNFDVKIRILRESYNDLIPANQPAYSPFRPGMSAAVDIQTQRVDQAVTIPIQAVTTRKDTTGNTSRMRARRQKASIESNDNTKSADARKKKKDEVREYVFIYQNGKAKMQRVKSGIQDNTYIEITEGLNADDEVIIAPYNAVTKKLKNGDAVKKVAKSELFKAD